MPSTTIINEDGSQIVVPSWDGTDHVRDLRSDPQAVPLRDESLPAVSGLLADLRDHVLAHATPEQREQIISANPTWRRRLLETADRTKAILGDDDIGGLVQTAPDVSYSERTEKCIGGERVTDRVWESASVGYRVVETVSYAHPYDHPAWRRRLGSQREAVRLGG